jgi:hypothetical protein
MSDGDGDLLILARAELAQSPRRALAWARSFDDPQLRARLLFAVLRAWGEKDPHAALAWAFAQNDELKDRYIEGALTGSAAQPAVALDIGRDLLSQDPTDDKGYGTILLGALSAAQHYDTAIEFANDGPANEREDWLHNIFNRWGQLQPEQAVAALGSISDDSLRVPAFQALVDGWAASNSFTTLAPFALTLPAGDQRAYALDAGLRSWCLQDPAGLATWLSTLQPGPEFDEGAALVATKTDTANRPTGTAVNWIETISDPDLRNQAFTQVLGEWAQTDPAAARQYVQSASWLNDNQRTSFLQALGTN